MPILKQITKPNIINTDGYVILGTNRHGNPIPEFSVHELISALEDAVALKMEGNEKLIKMGDAMSAETLSKVLLHGKPFSFISESDGHDIGFYLLKNGVPENIAEIYVPFMIMDLLCLSIEEVAPKLSQLYLMYMERFGFINMIRAMDNFARIVVYDEEQQLERADLIKFASKIEDYQALVREHQFWRPDLESFRQEYNGKVAVCCGNFHTNFVKAVLEGESVDPPPQWADYLSGLPEETQSIFQRVEELLIE